MPPDILIPDAVPGAAPGVSFSDILRFVPVLEALSAAVTAALAGGQTEIPAITLRVAGRKIKLGPAPVQLLP